MCSGRPRHAWPKRIIAGVSGGGARGPAQKFYFAFAPDALNAAARNSFGLGHASDAPASSPLGAGLPWPPPFAPLPSLRSRMISAHK